MGGSPGGDQQDRRPPVEPEQHHRTGDPAEQLDQAARDEVDVEVHRRAGLPLVELARDFQVLGQRRVLEVTDPGWLDAGAGEFVVEPGGDQTAEVCTDGLVDRHQDLQQHERDADSSERPGQPVAVLDRPDQMTHRDSEEGRQQTAHDQQQPPERGQRCAGARQDGEELPLGTAADAVDHAVSVPDPTDGFLERLPVPPAEAMIGR